MNTNSNFKATTKAERRLYLVGCDDSAGVDHVVRTEYHEELESLQEVLTRLFNKAHSKKWGRLANPRWWCGVPGVDAAVIFVANPVRGIGEPYLHVSFSDGRGW